MTTSHAGMIHVKYYVIEHYNQRSNIIIRVIRHVILVAITGTATFLCLIFNSLASERCGSNFKSIIFKLIIQNSSLYRIVAWAINTLRQRQNGRHFADDTFKRIFLNENVGISIKISLKFVHKGPINNIPALVQIMAWRRWGDKPLSESMMVNLLTHKWVTRPQWVNLLSGENATEPCWWEVWHRYR